MSIKEVKREEFVKRGIECDQMLNIDDTFFLIKKDDKLGVLDKSYNVILKPIYKSIDVVKDKMFVVFISKGEYQIFSERGMLVTNRVFALKRDAIDYAKFF